MKIFVARFGYDNNCVAIGTVVSTNWEGCNKGLNARMLEIEADLISLWSVGPFEQELDDLDLSVEQKEDLERSGIIFCGGVG